MLRFPIFALAVTAIAVPTSSLSERDSRSEQVVSLHHTYRAEYGAPPVTWNPSLYSGTLTWGTLAWA
ncbi:hypothetical protein BDZ97DRAFT_1823897 [Flammula alnicola]|nr:hypothetical protein BDZ97DRAFT_1823897 [Flammula alnicola]